MASCECLPKCIFFNDKMADMPVTAEWMKQRYCLGDNASCARYIIFTALGKEYVPVNLFPNHVDQAHRLLNQA